MSTLGKRLAALEEIAEQCRRRERDQELRAIILQRAAVRGWTLSPDELERAVARANATADRVEPWIEAGLSLDDAARRLATERGLDPEHVVDLCRTIRVERLGQ